MTTTIALETSKGELALALGLGIILVGTSIVVSACAFALGRIGDRSWSVSGAKQVRFAVDLALQYALPFRLQVDCRLDHMPQGCVFGREGHAQARGVALDRAFADHALDLALRVTPTSFKNLRIAMLKRSSSMDKLLQKPRHRPRK